MRLTYDESRFSLGDFEDFEEYAGRQLEEALKRYPVKDEDGHAVYADGKSADETDGKPATELRMSAREFTGLVWILNRLDNPAFTTDDARRVKMASVEIVPVEEDGPKESDDASAPVN